MINPKFRELLAGGIFFSFHRSLFFYIRRDCITRDMGFSIDPTRASGGGEALFDVRVRRDRSAKLSRVKFHFGL